VAGEVAEWGARLDAAFGPAPWRTGDPGLPLTEEQDALLRELLARVPAGDGSERAGSPRRKALLGLLGGQGPWLAYRVASHLWARDLAAAGSGSPALARAAQRWGSGEEWACLVEVPAGAAPDGSWSGQARAVPARFASSFLVRVGNRIGRVATGTAGLHVEPLDASIPGAAGLDRVRLDRLCLPEDHALLDPRAERVQAWEVARSADWLSVASGLAGQLARHAVQAARARVSLPGMVKRWLAEVGARRYLLETLDHLPRPAMDGDWCVLWAGLLRLVGAEALGTGPGGSACNTALLLRLAGPADPVAYRLVRAAALWAWLGAPPGAARRDWGERLAGEWDRAHTLLAPADGLGGESLRQALPAEVEEVSRSETRLDGLVRPAQGRRHPEGGKDSEAAAEVAEGLARQAADGVACRALLLRTHARIARGLNAETETALLRVSLDGAAVVLDQTADAVQRCLYPPGAPDRPVVEPGAAPPLGGEADYLAVPALYRSGDFLAAPVDLLQPRLVPEMISEGRRFDPGGSRRDRGPVREALDVERTAEVFSLTARMRELSAVCGMRAAEEARGGVVPDWRRWRLRRIEEELFTAEALAAEVVGRCLHPETRSLRLESVLARLFVAERLRQVQETAGQLLGPEGVLPEGGAEWGGEADLPPRTGWWEPFRGFSSSGRWSAAWPRAG
jgi:hypothetical protein